MAGAHGCRGNVSSNLRGGYSYKYVIMFRFDADMSSYMAITHI